MACGAAPGLEGEANVEGCTLQEEIRMRQNLSLIATPSHIRQDSVFSCWTFLAMLRWPLGGDGPIRPKHELFAYKTRREKNAPLMCKDRINSCLNSGLQHDVPVQSYLCVTCICPLGPENKSR